jgi:5-methylcytosine-specific restriction endonuclease McrA
MLARLFKAAVRGLPPAPPTLSRAARRSVVAQMLRAIEDRLIPTLRLSTHERAIYYHLLRKSHLRGDPLVGISRRALGRATGLNVSTARHYLGVLAQKRCIGFIDRGVRGCLVRVYLPDEILRRISRDGKRFPAAVAEPAEVRDAMGHPRAWPRAHDHKRERLRKRIFARERGRCFYCGKKLPRHWTLDHATPRLLGGADDVSNLVACCAVCNPEKDVRTAEDFLRSLRSRGVLSGFQLRSRLNKLRHVRCAANGDR